MELQLEVLLVGAPLVEGMVADMAMEAMAVEKTMQRFHKLYEMIVNIPTDFPMYSEHLLSCMYNHHQSLQETQASNLHIFQVQCFLYSHLAKINHFVVSIPNCQLILDSQLAIWVIQYLVLQLLHCYVLQC